MLTTIEKVKEYMLYERRLSQYNTKQAVALLRKIINNYRVLKPSRELGYRIEHDLADKGRKPRTIRNHLTVLELWADAFKIKDSDGKLLKFKMPKIDSHRIDSLTSEEARALLDYGALTLRDNAILYLLVYCAIRPKELINADVEDVDLIERKFYVRAKYDVDIESPGIKSHREREIPISRECAKAIRTYLDEGRPNYPTKALFFTNLGNRIAIRTLQDIVRDAAKRAGIKRRTYPYLCRHSGCTLMVESNINLLYISKIMGHSTLEQTRAYSHPQWRAMREAIDKNFVI
ncbi:putative site-specific recombinase [Methanocella paludicola SANAE]|uniref:Site-specific recombinase n=1 Tax=Methanocella paludicola (strain DSM 17711 / JCM 13418 / NBRC 101707 / SANAE) TaxID=304371 RepID=D1YZH2_METPS|nr:putative site-specific recombinase [Methanocella paludicola SANAE]